MSIQQQPVDPKIAKLQTFTSLIWYDSAIDFIFRFVAKTSELLLATGVIVSAADFLSRGSLMHDNPLLTSGWAWSQAIAIESSGGVVLLYALQSFKEKDTIKAWLYVALTALLASVGGVMLFTQIASNTTGIDLATSGPLGFTMTMAVLRSVVSIAYIVMCRTKHIRFTHLLSITDTSVPVPALVIPSTDELVNAVVERLDAANQQRFDSMVQEVKRTVVTVVQEEVTQHRLQALPKEVDSKTAQIIDSQLAKRSPAKPPAFDRFATVKQALIESPKITDKDLASLAKCSINTARKEKKLALVELAKEERR